MSGMSMVASNIRASNMESNMVMSQIHQAKSSNQKLQSSSSEENASNPLGNRQNKGDADLGIAEQ